MSWVTVESAGAYLENRVGAESWADLEEPAKLKYLITAYRILSTDPGLNFPEGTPTESMCRAQMELAAEIFLDPEWLERRRLNAQGVEKIRYGATTEEYNGKFEYPPDVMNLLREYVSSDNDSEGSGGNFAAMTVS